MSQSTFWHRRHRDHAWSEHGDFIATQLVAALAHLSRSTVFVGRTIVAVLRVPFRRTRRRELVTQLDALCVGALPITHLTGFIAGLLLGVQTRLSLQQFGVTDEFPALLTLSLVRELGPTFVSLVSGARAGSGVASELATMAVTQQVDAMRALRHDPIDVLAGPRTLACIIGFPGLALVGVLAGLFGGMLVAVSLEQTPSYFYRQAWLNLSLPEIVPNLLVKPAVYGLLIGVVPSYLGLSAAGGTQAVGGATVRSVVIVTVGVLVADYLVGGFFRAVWPPPM